MATPLKIRDAAGNIQELTTAEENYLTYIIGTHLADDSANGIGGITTNSGHTSIGSYTNTFFNEPVGTHPSTSITSGSTVTTLYQNQGTAANETDSDVVSPLMWIDADGETGFKQMPTSDLNSAVDRYLTKLFTNDYPGVFKLGSSSPGPDYSVWLNTVFTDTRTDGTSVAYNIYRRDTYTIPTAIPPMFARDNAGFDGIQAMNIRKIKQSFGQRAKSRIGASKIGTYQLRSSSQGAPTDPGTWISAGAATDTKQTTSQQQFTSVFTAQYQKGYTRAYTRVFSGSYVQNYVSSKNVGYVGSAFLSLYSRSFLRQQSESFGRNYTRLYTGNYLRNYVKAYTPNYVKRYTGNYQRTYVRGFNTTYQRTGPATYDPTTYLPNYFALLRSYAANPGQFLAIGGDLATAPSESPVGDVFWGYGADLLKVPVGSYLGLLTFERTRGPDFIGPHRFLGEGIRGPGTIPSRFLLDTPTLGLVGGSLYGGSLGQLTGAFPGGPAILISQVMMRIGDWLSGDQFPPGAIEDQAHVSFAPFDSPVYQWGAKWFFTTGPASYTPAPNPFIPYGNTYNRGWTSGGIPDLTIPPAYERSYLSPAQLYIRNLGYLNRINTATQKPGWYTRQQVFDGGAGLGYVAKGFKLYLGPAAGDVHVAHPEILNFLMNANFFNGKDGGFPGANPILIAGIGYLAGYVDEDAVSNYTTTYNRNFAINYASVTDVGYIGGAFNRSYSRNFVRNTNVQYLRNYTGIYSSIYTRAYDKLYTPNYIRAYEGNYDKAYTSAYTRLFNTTYLTDYARAYTGNFEGLTIDSESETNETYTLYVRIS